MNEILTFHRGSDSTVEGNKPYHYRACGVDGIYLHDGFKKVDDGYGESVVIEAVEELHKVIGLKLVQERPHLAAREVRFLREQMGKTQIELANEIGVSGQMIARYEKEDQTDVTGPSDRLLRAIYVTHLFPEQQSEIMQTIIHLYMEAETDAKSLIFSKAENHWTRSSSEHSAVC
jgi:transcriptional regulator with XRE-family HTH domain